MDNGFRNCHSLTTIPYDSIYAYYGNSAFRNCRKLVNVPSVVNGYCGHYMF